MFQQSISRAIHEITNAIISTFSEQLVHFPRTALEKHVIKQRFMEARGFPGVIGAIDCTHVEILRPTLEEHNYLNRKGYHSKNIQIVCDHDLKILNINARFAGASHDSYIWRNSLVRNELEACYHGGMLTVLFGIS
ncbi:unnamed protein product [Acanthoscelides obtectus]|uniref:DDE Tnp4 domain-containing protein n=1 Tax=Acanthoscelides obtectus TaxID=200917 RepID=A0A9P0Q7S8_ACAOB|nr:unnamed protein product [Acanthoscelides obtectus]CAK1652072.1 Putative nuclease HARBI1 [Acanthoscelides obtectus]